jgi:transposase
VEVEAAFKNLKSELAIRPIFHQREDRIEAHTSSLLSLPTASR